LSIFAKILNAGFYPGIGYRERISIVTANVLIISLFFAGLMWAVIAQLLDLGVMVAINLVMAFVALLLHVGMHVANTNSVKSAVILSVATYFAIQNLLLGWGSGIEFYGAPILMGCFLLFPNRQHPGARIMLLLTAAIVFGTYVAMSVIEPKVFISEAVLTSTYVLTVIAILPTSLILMLVFQRQSRQIVNRLHDEHSKVQEIVSSVLPDMIALRLKEGNKMIADSHGGATVLFADIVGFTKLTSRLAPVQLVESLDVLFTRMGESAKSRGIEKIKTIGDCYMAACGVLDEIHNPAIMIEFAKELRLIVQQFSETLQYPLGVRIGIAYGQVISGVIGREKKTFDLWGETVNLASRMESTGESGRIQVTESLYWRLRGEYLFEKRENTEVKGVGLITTYFLEESDLRAD
jgi:class 3 adenylate cyclase